jgi:hypothetical protein
VDSLLFLVEMVGPVGVEVAVADEGAELEDGFGAVDAPAGSCDVHAVFDEVTARAFNDAGGDGPAVGQGGGVVQVGLLVEQVGGGGVGGFAGVVFEVLVGGLAPDGGGDGAGVAGQDRQGLFGDPGFGGGVGLGVEAPVGLP